MMDVFFLKLEASFRARVAGRLELFAFLLSLLAVSLVLALAFEPSPPPVNIGVLMMLLISLFYFLLAARWEAEWLIYLAQSTLAGSYLYYRVLLPLSPAIDVFVLALFCLLSLGVSELFENRGRVIYARPTLNFSVILALSAPVVVILRGEHDGASISLLFFAATFFAAVRFQKGWRQASYASGLLYNAGFWLLWMQGGWTLAEHPQFYLIPVGFSAILFAEVNRGAIGLTTVNIIRSLGTIVMALSSALPIVLFSSFGTWVVLLFLSLGGIFAGIAMRVQTFVWMGLFFLFFDVLYLSWFFVDQFPFAIWVILVGVGLLLMGFVVLNERMQLAAKMKDYYDQIRDWE